MKVILRGWTREGYSRDLLVMDEQQVRISEKRFQDGPTPGGVAFSASDFPEVLHFEVIVENDK